MKSNFRTAITVPEKCWSRFRDILNDYCDKMKKTQTQATTTTMIDLSSSSPPIGLDSPTLLDGAGGGGGDESGAVGGLTAGMLLGPIGAAAICAPSGVGLAGLVVGSGLESGLVSSSNGTIGGGGHK